jgi:hypothetical protein
MLCSSEDGRVVYCLNDALYVSEIVFEMERRNKPTRQIKSASTMPDPAFLIGRLAIEFEKVVPLYDFSWPWVERGSAAIVGKYYMDVVNINIPRHKYLRNIDLVLMPGTCIGLMFSGIVAHISRQQLQVIDADDVLLHLLDSRVFRPYKQLPLPFLTVDIPSGMV